MTSRELWRKGLRGLFGALLGVAVGSTPAAASLFTQDVFVRYFTNPLFSVSDAQSTHGFVPSDLKDVTAHIDGSSFSATAAAGALGNVGVTVDLAGRSNLSLQLLSASVEVQALDVLTNTTGIPQRIHSDFLIDGGSLLFIGDDNSRADFQLQLSTAVNQGVAELRFISGGRMDLDPLTHQRRLTTSGADIGTFFPFGPHHLMVIPASLQRADLGILYPGDSLSLFYEFTFDLAMGPLAELESGSFSDPFSLSEHPVLGTITAEPVDSVVPEPSTFVLTGCGFFLMICGCWRRGRRT